MPDGEDLDMEVWNVLSDEAKKSGEGVNAVRDFLEDSSIEDPPASRWLHAMLNNHARDWERSHAEDAIILTAQPWQTVGWRVEMKSG